MATTYAPAPTADSLAQQWQDLRAQHPQLRIRDAAQRLQVSEAQLLATQVGQAASRLQGPWHTLLQRMPELGPIMALTRNEAVVIEKDGTFSPPQFMEMGAHQVGQVVGPHIDLRLFMQHWAHAYAVPLDKGKQGTLYSFQFFDHAGQAILKVFADSKEADLDAYHRILTDHTHPEQTRELNVLPHPGPIPYYEQPALDTQALLDGWAAMTDTHQFFPLLRKHDVHRYHALQVAAGRFAWQVTPHVLVTMLQVARDTGLSIMAFVGNAGCLEIHTGAIKHLVQRDDWYNIMDPSFNLHVHMPQLTTAFVVEKPTSDGPVTSLEFYNAHKELVVQFFGERKPGKPELPAWRTLATGFIQSHAV